MTTSWTDSPVFATLRAVALHVILWSLFLAKLIFIVPRLVRIFADYQMKLPAFTEMVVAVSEWLSDFFYLIPVFLVPLLLLDAAVYYCLWRIREMRWAARLWSGMMILPLLAALLFIVLALALAYIKLLDGLSR